MPFTTLENYVFLPFSPFLTLIKPIRAESFTFDQTFKLRIEKSLIYSGYT